MNKQRKKCKLESIEDYEYRSAKSSQYGATSPTPGPPQNAYQLVQLMYKQDALDARYEQSRDNRYSGKQLLQYNQNLRGMNDL